MEEDTEAMLVINGHWQDAACGKKGRRMVSGWSQLIPRVCSLRDRTPTLETSDSQALPRLC